MNGNISNITMEDRGIAGTEKLYGGFTITDRYLSS
jgi:hypothetical protein